MRARTPQLLRIATDSSAGCHPLSPVKRPILNNAMSLPKAARRRRVSSSGTSTIADGATPLGATNGLMP